MDTTNNPDEGTGSATELTGADTFKALLDSENATTDIEGTDNTEANLASLTSEEEVEDDAEQPNEDSEGAESDETDDAADEAEADASTTLGDETLIDVNGEMIALKDLKANGLRQSDYTKKMQELASLRKQWVVQEVDKQELRSQVEQQITGLMTVVANTFDFAEPNWREEWEKDPYEARLKEMDWKEKQAKREEVLRGVHAAQQKLEADRLALAQEQFRQRKIEARETLAREMPEQFGGSGATATLGAIETFLREQNVPDEMISNIDNAAIIKLAYYAMQHMRVAKQVPKAVKKAEAKPALTMPGSTASKRPANDFNAKLREFAKSGEKSGQGMFKALLDNE